MSEPDSPRRGLAGSVFLTLFGLLVIASLGVLPFWAGPPPEDGLPDLAKFLGRFHPVMLHLPIGMLLLVLLLETGRVFSRRKGGSSTLVAMFFASASAVVATVLGFLLYYSSPDYNRELAERHLYGGIIFACGTVAAFLVKLWVDVSGGRGAFLYWALLLGSAGVMGFASHDGASLTHGKDYLTQYAPDPVRELLGLPVKAMPEGKSDSPGKPVAERIVYAEIVKPILEEKCYSCHNAEKDKGKYRMDEYELLVKGGKEGDGIVPGDVGSSNMIVRIDLPEDDDEHMPPEGKKDLEAHEVEIIKWWIGAGASPDATVATTGASDEILAAISRLVPAEELTAKKAEEDENAKRAEEQREAVKSEVERLRKEFPAALNFESQSSPWLVFTAVSMRKDFGDDDLEKLAPVLPAMVSLDLSASTVTDKGASLLERAVELRTLRLSETAVTDAGVESLAKLPKLESLNLYGTQVGNDGLKKLASLQNLKKLYLWQTRVEPSAVEEFKKAVPGCEVVMGL